MQKCTIHPEKNAYSICQNCKNYFCEVCLDEGKVFYYCKKVECQQRLKEELASK
jgi:hypothetical protein